MSNLSVGNADRDPQVERAIRLFDFLARSQQLKTRSPRSVRAYERDGAVLWLVDVPRHPAVTAACHEPEPSPEAALLTVDRVRRAEPPAPDGDLLRWVTEPLDDPDQPPTLRGGVDSGGNETRTLSIDDRPDVREAFDQWLARWQSWADQELLDRPVRALHSSLFSMYQRATGNPEDFELVVGVGCLVWEPEGHEQVERHLFTAPLVIQFDDDTGRVGVHRTESVDALAIELDMLDPGLVAGSQQLTDIRGEARTLESHPLHRAAVGTLVRRLVNSLDADGEYWEQDERPSSSSHAVAAFAPAILLRRRSQQGLVEILQTVGSQLAESNEVPDGLLPLIDPNHVPRAERAAVEGALVTVDDEPFLPLPVNDVQLRILRHVDTNAQTLVQGPPGTGKTHTAAALLSHLLAQGKRVLVTAQTDRALKEVRDKLPAEIRPLSVAVVGTSREDMSDLKVAVDRISSAKDEHEPQAAQETIRSCLDAIDGLRRQRALVHRTLVEAREREVREHEHAGYRGTLAAIAQRHRAESDRFEWLNDHVDVGPDTVAPLSSREISEWHGYLCDQLLLSEEAEVRRRRPDVTLVPTTEEFAELVAAERAAIRADERFDSLKAHPAFAAVSGRNAEVRGQVQQRLRKLADQAQGLAARRATCMNDALADVRSGRASIWKARAGQISELIDRAAPVVERLGALTEVSVSEGEIGPLAALAKGLRDYLADGKKLKTAPDGTPRTGAFAGKLVKHAQPLFDRVRVDGLPPTTPTQLDAFLSWVEATKALSALDRAWPESVRLPTEDTLHEHLQWHRAELDQLRGVVDLAEALEQEEQRLAEARLPKPDWNDIDAVLTYARLVDAATAADDRIAAGKPLEEVEKVVQGAAQWADAASSARQMLQAVHARDHEVYASTHTTMTRLVEVSRAITRRDHLAERLQEFAPALWRAVEQEPDDAQWSERLGTFEEAWAWAATGAWVFEQDGVDVNVLQDEVTLIENRIRDHVETLASTRAWSHAVAPDRLTGEARKNLNDYAYLVKRLGKGTGVHAARRRANIRRAIGLCRPAVPVWIMPIYRIAEQFRIQPDMFDVVIVDEASQAGLEATFLQYLAPTIVVIGDDKQVSPAAVGIDQRQLRDLAAQHLPDGLDRELWADPKRSLFDEAKSRYHGRLTLIEHRRCVPEIIGFSNRVAYEPDGVRLVPVRQYGADRLKPIETVFLPEGYEKGVTNKVNPVEVEAVVDRIEKCLADPRYDGMTFGVISLLGSAQAKQIEQELLSRISTEEIVARRLRCGDAADFQGSERDVMFLSMVKAPEPGKRIGALTGDLYVQRFNVAASRAKDQMWVFHSVSLSDLGNPEDMRFQLLDYCEGVSKRGQLDREGAVAGAVPEDQRVKPFDSLFEQRVFNRLHDRGYTVFPQYPAEGYRIDLVVLGAKSRLAIECDGDAWHGPDAYERDLARQRDLERCGWKFFRVRESAFYVDRASALEPLWAALLELDIHPSGWTPEAVEEPAATEDAETDDWDPEPHEDVSSPQSSPAVAAYDTFAGVLPPALDATRRQVVEGLQAIVAAEGPVLGHRLHIAYVHAASGQRVGPSIAKALNSAIGWAVRQGLLVEDNPLGEVGIKPRTYRLPEQPRVRVRDLGPRRFEHLPPLELAALMSQSASTWGWDDEESVYRGALELLGLKRLTPNVNQRCAAVFALARDCEG